MRWRAQITSLFALALLGLGVTACAGTKVRGAPARSSSARPSGAPARSPAPATASPAPDPTNQGTVYATVAAPSAAAPVSPEFLGVSLEFSALEAYTGANPTAINPVFVQLLRNFDRPLVLRIGGNSTDATWWPVPGMSRPPGVTYSLTPGWLASARALAGELGAKLILGLNLAADRPRLTAAEARALLQGVGAGNVAALELGNEPDVYGLFPWYRDRGRPVFARGAGYGLSAFLREVRQSEALLPPAPLAGPATAERSWLPGLPAIVAAEPGLRIVTVHRYPTQGCLEDRGSPTYPSIANLLSDRSSAGLAQGTVPYAAFAHLHGLAFRVDELNSSALAGCLGRTGVSNTFASALWMLDTLFNMASAGVDGVNVHTLPGAGYELFTFSRGPSGWQAFVHPDYYGMLMFAQACPVGAELLPVHATAGPVKVWASHGPDGRFRVALINKDARPHQVELQLPSAGGPATLEWLRAPSVGATTGVTLGGQTFGIATGTGALPPPQLQPVAQLLGSYSIELPADSAALLTR